MAIRVLDFKQDYSNGKAVDMVLIAPIGEAHQKTQTWHRVKALEPTDAMRNDTRKGDSLMAMDARWSIIGPAYEAWKNNSGIPETGMPLAAWSGVTKDQAQLLKGMGMLTVQDVAEASQEAVAKLPFPNARKFPALAKAFLDGEEASAKDARLAEMEERMAVMTEMLEKQAEDKPKRGRPAKKDSEAA